MSLIDKINKVEATICELVKVEDPSLSAALRHLDAAAKTGAIDPNHVKALRQHIFVDKMTGLGNKAAYQDFISRPRQGVHVVIDSNDLSSLNKIHGQTAGDKYIEAYGKAVHRASKRFKGKAFRSGGDEVNAFFETPEQAYGFTRHLRNELDALPPLGGTHKFSASIGIGNSVGDAEQALLHAKGAKKAGNHLPGTAPTYAHSLVSGHEGPLSINPIKPPLPLKVPERSGASGGPAGPSLEASKL